MATVRGQQHNSMTYTINMTFRKTTLFISRICCIIKSFKSPQHLFGPYVLLSLHNLPPLSSENHLSIPLSNKYQRQAVYGPISTSQFSIVLCADVPALPSASPCTLQKKTPSHPPPLKTPTSTTTTGYLRYIAGAKIPSRGIEPRPHRHLLMRAMYPSH
jgi:hypothetical protein